MNWSKWLPFRRPSDIPELMEPVTIEQDSENWHDCSCCGDKTRQVIGFVHHFHGTVAAYFVRWIPGHLKHGASMTLVIGKWGEGTFANQRSVVEIAARWRDGAAEFMLIDADLTKYADLAAYAFPRREIVGSLSARRAFAISDAVWGRDPRLMELRGA